MWRIRCVIYKSGRISLKFCCVGCTVYRAGWSKPLPVKQFWTWLCGKMFRLYGLSIILCERNASRVLSDSPTYLCTRTVYYAVKYFECYLKVSHRRHVCSITWHAHFLSPMLYSLLLSSGYVIHVKGEGKLWSAATWLVYVA